jgi:ADP-ribose pyrophosphatase
VTGAPDLPQILASRTVYHSRVFNVAETRVRFADGAEVEHAIVQHPGAVAIVALDETGSWLLVRQYRVAAGRELLEIPAGTLEPGEEPLATAHRELREETGFAAAAMEPLGRTVMAPGFCTEYIHYFLATGLRPDPLQGDDDERISEPIPMWLDDVLTAILAGEIEDAKTVVAATLLRLHEAARVRDAGVQTAT